MRIDFRHLSTTTVDWLKATSVAESSTPWRRDCASARTDATRRVNCALPRAALPDLASALGIVLPPPRPHGLDTLERDCTDKPLACSPEEPGEVTVDPVGDGEDKHLVMMATWNPEHPCFLARFLRVSAMVFSVVVYRRSGVPPCRYRASETRCSLWFRRRVAVHWSRERTGWRNAPGRPCLSAAGAAGARQARGSRASAATARPRPSCPPSRPMTYRARPPAAGSRSGLAGGWHRRSPAPGGAARCAIGSARSTTARGIGFATWQLRARDKWMVCRRPRRQHQARDLPSSVSSRRPGLRAGLPGPVIETWFRTLKTGTLIVVVPAYRGKPPGINNSMTPKTAPTRPTSLHIQPQSGTRVAAKINF